MNWIDIIVLIPLCWFAYKGLKNGFLQELISLCALFLGVFISFKFSDLVVHWITGTTFAKPVSFIICFLVIILLVNLLGGVLKRTLKPVFSEFIDKFLGIIFGILKVVVAFTAIFFFVDNIDKNSVFIKKETKENSIAYRTISPIMPFITQWQVSQKEEKTDDQIENNSSKQK